MNAKPTPEDAWMTEAERKAFNRRSSYSYSLAEHEIRTMVRRLLAALSASESEVSALKAELKESEAKRARLGTEDSCYCGCLAHQWRDRAKKAEARIKELEASLKENREALAVEFEKDSEYVKKLKAQLAKAKRQAEGQCDGCGADLDDAFCVRCKNDTVELAKARAEAKESE